MTSGSLNSGHATSLTGSATDAAKKMKGGSLSDAIDAFDSAVALAKTTGNTTQLRRIASDALNFVRKSDKTTDYMKKNVVPRMQEEFTEVFGADITESGQPLREVSAYRLGKRFGKAAVAAATGVGQKASGAAKTDIVQRGGKSVSVRRDIGGAGGGQFVNALTSMRQSMTRSLTLGRRAERMRRIVGTSDKPLFVELPSDPRDRSDEIRRRQIDRLRGGAGKKKLTGAQQRERAARRKADEERRKAEEEKRREEIRRRDEDAKKRAEEERQRQEREAEQRRQEAEQERKRASASSMPKPVAKSSSGVSTAAYSGNTEISSTLDLYKPSDIALISGTGWQKYRGVVQAEDAKDAIRALDSLLIIPPSERFDNPSVGIGVSGIPIFFKKSNVGYGGHFQWRSNGKSEIVISPSSKDGRGTLFHEFGHFIDAELFKRPDYIDDSEYSPPSRTGSIPEVTRVLELAEQSDGFRRLIQFAHERDLAGGRMPTTTGGWVDYYGDRAEIFARVFAQWAVISSGGNLDEFLKNNSFYGSAASGRSGLARVLGIQAVYSNQWLDPDEFAPIAAAMDDLFDSAGWRI